jgi:fumarylacetoacetate (FAA) hydrolase
LRLVTFAAGGADHVGELHADGSIAELQASDMIEWLAGSGRAESSRTYQPDEVMLRAPVPTPPAIRDFYAYEGHVRAGFARRGVDAIPDAWYEAPVFYFSNPASVRGSGEPVRRPEGCEQLDFELEIAAIIGAGGQIAGFTLMNDWSARDIQRREMTVGLGPAKGKDFATSLGPFLATPDELPFDRGRLSLEATVSVNGSVLSRCDAAEMHFSWPELVAHAARGTRLRPGDVLGSGTLTGGCLLELGGSWIGPGDEVVLSAPGLGELRTLVER